jgi:hypothetical protein
VEAADRRPGLLAQRSLSSLVNKILNIRVSFRITSNTLVDGSVAIQVRRQYLMTTTLVRSFSEPLLPPLLYLICLYWSIIATRTVLMILAAPPDVEVVAAVEVLGEDNCHQQFL